jgi:hypothetical protein
MLTNRGRRKMLKHSTAQHSTAQHSTAQHSTAQHSSNLTVPSFGGLETKNIMFIKTRQSESDKVCSVLFFIYIEPTGEVR